MFPHFTSIFGAGVFYSSAKEESRLTPCRPAGHRTVFDCNPIQGDAHACQPGDDWCLEREERLGPPSESFGTRRRGDSDEEGSNSSRDPGPVRESYPKAHAAQPSEQHNRLTGESPAGRPSPVTSPSQPSRPSATRVMRGAPGPLTDPGLQPGPRLLARQCAGASETGRGLARAGE